MTRFVRLSDLEREWLARAYGDRLVRVSGEENLAVWRRMQRRGLVAIEGNVLRIGNDPPSFFGYITPKGALQLRTLTPRERERWEREHAK